MKIIKLSGGIGNQMFQYLFGQHLSRIHKEKVFYDIEYFKNKNLDKRLDKRNMELLKFDLNIDIVDSKKFPFLNYHKKKDKIIYLLKGLISLNRNTFNIVSESKHTFISKILSIFFKNSYYIGYWHQYRFLTNEIKFKLRKDQKIINSKIKEEILNSNAICIGIRRGDYVKLGLIICDLNYYKKGIDLINNKVIDPVYFIFSDDIEWCKQNIKISNKHFFVQANQDTPFENIELMSLCKHNIISNSTYEWWGAMLNKNSKKIVICHKSWKLNESEKGKLIPDDWLKI